MTSSIILLGIKHSGKTTQGKLLAEKFSTNFIDVDDVITQITGKTPRENYQIGIQNFIQVEEDACRKIHKTYLNNPIVISTGGGICDNPMALQELREMGSFVFLNIEESIACERILKKANHLSTGEYENLPAYIAKHNPKTEKAVKEIFHEFYIARTETYKKIADVIIEIEDATKEENLQKIISALS